MSKDIAPLLPASLGAERATAFADVIKRIESLVEANEPLVVIDDSIHCEEALAYLSGLEDALQAVRELEENG